MKLIKNIIYPFIATAIITLASCSDFLTVTPHDSLNSDNALETLDDFDNATRSVYESMRSQSYTSVFMTMVPDIMSDNLVLNQGGRLIYNELANFNFSSVTYGFAGMWSVGYNAILSANEVITRLEADPSLMSEDETLGANLLAECLALRGLIHYDLVRCFGKNYQQASDSDLGVTYKDNTEIITPARNTVKEVYALALADLNNAYDKMGTSYNSTINYRLTKKSVAAILAKIYLTMGDYSNAVKFAGLSVTGDGSDMVGIDDYSKMYTTSMNIPEVLFRIAITSSDGNLPGNQWGQGTASSYQANYSVSYSLNNLFTSTDIRRSMVRLVECDGGPCYVVWKWNSGGSSIGLVDIPYIRTAEMYLILAEANYRLGGPDNATEALKYLNIIREKRYSDYTAGTETGSALESAIMLQRRLELAFEGHRFFDLKRLNQNVERDGMGYFSDGSGAPSDVQLVLSTSPYYLMAIPQDELDANDNMVQNQY